ncbi:MAG: HD domain-containing protein [Firmicutes bacterium]|nr:HD domain-containing protein [Bacillota bacterium]
MRHCVDQLVEGIELTGDLLVDVRALFVKWDQPHTFQHCLAVSQEAYQLAESFSVNTIEAEMAGLFHDIGKVVPRSEMVALAEALKLDVLPEERLFPSILHQRLSAEIARRVFQIDAESILSAIGCHTTLKKGALPLDKVVFLADKIRWDQPTKAPFADALLTALKESLDCAVLCYLNYLWERRGELGVLHPWLVEARDELLKTKSDT